MKKTKGYEKNIKIYIRGQEDLALTFFDQIIYSELKEYITTYESKFDDEFIEIEDKDEAVRRIIVMVTLKEDYGNFRIAMKLYQKLNEKVDDLECKIFVDDDIIVDGVV